MEAPEPTELPPEGINPKQPRAPKWWLLALNLSSLDAPIVSVIWARLFAESLGVRLFPGMYPVLFCAVWSIYLADRLLDTRQGAAGIPRTARHLFFRQHWKWMFLLGLTASGIGIWQATMVAPAPLIGSGIFLSALVALYFLLRMAGGGFLNFVFAAYLACLGGLILIMLIISGTNLVVTVVLAAAFVGLAAMPILATDAKQGGVPRELLCGMIFAAGTALPAYWLISDSSFPFGIEMFTIPSEMLYQSGTILNADILLFGALCTLNCIGISIWEKDADAEGNDFDAVAQYYPEIERLYIPLLIALSTLALAWTTPAIWKSSWIVRFPIIASAALLAVLHLNRRRLRPDTLRVLADAALFSPLAVIPFV